MSVKKANQVDRGEKTSPPINLATLYSGRSQHAVDDSNRIMLPSAWRVEGAPTQFFVLLVADTTDHLLVLTPSGFEALLAELRADTADQDEIPVIERQLTDRVRQVSLDRVGRLPLPADLLARANIEKQGELVGRFSKFEIWPGNKEKSAGTETQALLPRLATKLKRA